MDNVLLCETVP